MTSSNDIMSQSQSDFEKLSKELSSELKILKTAKAEYEREIEQIAKTIKEKPEYKDLLDFYKDALERREEEIKTTRQDLFELVRHYEEYVKSYTAYDKSAQKAQLFLEEVQDKRERDHSRLIDLAELVKDEEDESDEHDLLHPKSSRDKLF